MSDEKIKILENISKAIDQMNDSQRDYMTGFGDGLIASVGLSSSRKEKKDDDKEEEPAG